MRRSRSMVPEAGQDIYPVCLYGGRLRRACGRLPKRILAGIDPQPHNAARAERKWQWDISKLAILVLAYALISSPAFAQTCCPAGCAPEANRCVTTGPLWTRCIPIACAEGSRGPFAGSSGSTREHRKSAVLARPLRTARTYVAPRQIPPHCPLMNPTKAQIDEATNQCVNALIRSAQLRDCFFEDDAGRAEDKRTGLSCPDRQAALAKQCLKRCANYASDTTHLVCTGSYPNTVWHISFGDISGDTGNSARVDLCGPPLRSIFAKKPPPG
jgi:hypothetical protein